MTMTQIRYFVEVAKHMNFTKAASDLYVVQQVVSKQVRRLEEEIGCPLFVRQGKKLELTAGGEILYAFWSDMLKRQEDALRQAHSVMHGAGKWVGTLAISSAQDRISVAISALCEKTPGWKFVIENGSYRELRQKLVDSKLDCIISLVDENLGLPEEYEEQAFLELWPSLVISKNHPLYREGITIKDLSETTFYILSRKFSRMAESNILKYCELCGVNPKHIEYFDDVNSMEMALYGGSGVALIYAEFFRNPMGVLQFISLAGNPGVMSTRFSVTYPRGKRGELWPFIEELTAGREL